MEENYDGEGAKAPNADSISLAVDFVNLLEDSKDKTNYSVSLYWEEYDGDPSKYISSEIYNKLNIPEEMVNPNGNIGLFWETDGLYADLEFFDNDRISYFIKKDADIHHGSVLFERPNFPEIFQLLLSTPVKYNCYYMPF